MFRKEKYHHVRLALEGTEAVSNRIVSPEDAQAIRDACDGQRAVCVSLVREKKAEKPPKLYDLTTLQREANRVFGYTAKQTLDYAQSLYEKKLLTYPLSLIHICVTSRADGYFEGGGWLISSDTT